MALSKIDPAPYNPRVDLQPGDPAYVSIQRSLDEFGLVEPLVWNRRSGHLVGGHQRLKIIAAAGATAVQVSVVDLDPKRERLLNLALNRVAGDWDEEKLSLMMADLERRHADLTLTGFTSTEIDGLLAQALAEAEDEEGPAPKIDQAAELQRKWKVKTGQIWQVGDHRLLCGDCTKPDQVKALMGRSQADLVFTDPPYGVNYVGSAEHLRIANDNLGEAGTKQLVLDACRAWPLKPGGAFYVCSSGGPGEMLFRLALEEAGYKLRQGLVWVKQQFVLGRQDYHWRHESILYGWAAGAGHYFTDDLTQDTILFDQMPALQALTREELLEVLKEYRRQERSTVWREDKPKVNALHPTIKPVPLVAKAIRNSSRRGEIVFDGFAGAGSTLVAAEQFDRRCYAIELDPRYAAVELERMADMGLRPRKVKECGAN